VVDSAFQMPPDEAFVEFPGMRGLRIARVGQADGKTLEVIEGVKGVVIPAMTSPGSEKGRVLEGQVRLVTGGEAKTLSAGDTWEMAAGEAQGPHVFLETSKVIVLREGKSAFDD
jgi:quercetin dioxygenase-like cupin family protein